ncbi:hypothetical protein CALVIDRAFT_531976, partial [Calocera viscosa TUFC12733]
NKRLQLSLFCNMGLFRVFGTDARLLSAGAPEPVNYGFQGEAALLAQWTKIKERWQAKDYEGVLTDMFGEHNVETFKAKKLLLPAAPAPAPRTAVIADAVVDLRPPVVAKSSQQGARRQRADTVIDFETAKRRRNY